MHSQENILLVEDREKLIGISAPRVDLAMKVTGKLVYTHDMKMHKMLFAKIKRCPYPHARIVNINVSRATELPGVRAIVTPDDFPSPINEDTPPLAFKEALYANQAIAAVAAETNELAETASNAIDIEYEDFPRCLIRK